MSEPDIPIRCLVLDDEPDDILLLRRQLRRSGLEIDVTAIERVDELGPALALPCDILLTDYRLAGATALDALRVAAALRPDLPVIVVSGVIDEEEAGAAFRAGARDFVTKRRLERLAPAMLRELEGAAERRRSADLTRELAASESRMAAVLGRIPALVWQIDTGLRLASLSGALLPTLLPGWKELMGKSLEDWPGVRPEIVSVHRLVLESGRGMPLEFVTRGIVLSCRIEPIVSATGKIEGVVGFGFDVSHDREQERLVGELVTLVQALADPVLFVDADGVVRSANPAADAVLRRQAEPLIGVRLLDLFDASQTARVAEALRRSLRNERVTGVEATVQCPDGSAVEVELSLAPVQEHGVIVGAAVVARDIGGRKALEAELRHAQKLEAVGQLAAGIAHDLNNVLLAVRGYATLLAEDVEGTPSEPDVRAIGDVATRGSLLVARLLAFARKQVLVPEIIDVGEAVQRLAPLLGSMTGRGVVLTIDVPPGLPSVDIDPSQLDQVLVNLVINARHAMSDKGTVHIALAPTACADGRPGLQLDVLDSGPGIAPAVAVRMFEPFFTTKAEAGAGLGLSIVAGIVAGAGGTIAQSDGAGPPGRPGARFTVVLPAADGVAAAAGAAVPAPATGMGGRVLLVDDDEPALAVVARLLARGGYEVLTAVDAASAHALLDASWLPQVLVADLNVREAGGGSAVPALAARLPDAGIIAMSGGSERDVLHGLRPGVRLLAKPFGSDELLAAVSAVRALPLA